MKSGTFKFILLIVFLAAAMLVSLLRAPKQQEANNTFDLGRALQQEDGVLLLDISEPIVYQQNSPILTGGASFWISQIDKASQRDSVEGLLMRINSPGGTIAASQEVYEALLRFKATGKPIVVSVKDVCASGAYYISLPADVIMANRGSLIGSIGARISYLDISKLLDKWGIESGDIVSVPHKDIFSMTRGFSDFERKHLQSTVEQMHEFFVSDVVKWRADKSSQEILRNAANGLIYTSTEALELGLIDEVGDFISAKKKMASLLNQDYETLKFSKPIPFSWF